MDLARFDKCTIKAPALCDLMSIDEFKDRVGHYGGDITDEWVVKLTEELYNQFKILIGDRESPKIAEYKYKYYTLRQKYKMLRKFYPQYMSTNAEK